MTPFELMMLTEIIVTQIAASGKIVFEGVRVAENDTIVDTLIWGLN